MITYLNYLNFVPLKSHSENFEDDNIIYDLLYISYLFFFGILFLSNDFFLPYKIFLFATMPLSLLPVYLNSYRNVSGARRFKIVLSIVNPIKTFAIFRSGIFILVCIYLGVITLSTTIYPSPSIGWFLDIIKYSISILFFIAISARIMGASSRSMEKVCTVLCLIVTINAAINIYYYFMNLPNLQNLSLIRFSPTFGRNPDHFPTTSALTYAVFFSISVALAIQSKPVVTRIIACICGLVLLLAVVLTQSRGPLIASLISLIFVSSYLSAKIRAIMAVLVGLIVSGFLLLPGIGTSALQRGENARFEVWNKFLSLGLLRPYLGYGERIEFHVEIRNAEIIGHAHNIYISALIRGGVIAALTLILITSNSIKSSIELLRVTGNYIPLCSILTIAIAGLVDFDLIIFLADWQWSSFWLILGIIANAKMYCSST